MSLKVVLVLLQITSSGNSFQSLTTLLLKEYFRISILDLPVLNFKLCPLVLVLWDKVKNFSPLTPSWPFNILKVSMRSPLNLLNLRLGSPRYSSLCLYSSSFKPSTILVNLCWTLSRISGIS